MYNPLSVRRAHLAGCTTNPNGDAREEALRLGALCEERYASCGVRSCDHPNVTFQDGQSCDVARVRQGLAKLYGRLHPFEVVIDGFGFLEHPSRTLFLRCATLRIDLGCAQWCPSAEQCLGKERENTQQQ